MQQLEKMIMQKNTFVLCGNQIITADEILTKMQGHQVSISDAMDYISKKHFIYKLTKKINI